MEGAENIGGTGGARLEGPAALWLAYVLGLAHREIAAIAGLAEGSVRVLLHRARARFSEILEGRGFGPRDLA